VPCPCPNAAHCLLLLRVDFLAVKAKAKELRQPFARQTKNHSTPKRPFVLFAPGKKRGKLFNIKSLPLYNPGRIS